MSLHLVGVTDQKVFIMNGDVAVSVPDDGNTYTAAGAVYAGTLMRLAEVENTALPPGEYSVMLLAVVTAVPVETSDEDSTQLTLPGIAAE